jgi:hypothetical protein
VGGEELLLPTPVLADRKGLRTGPSRNVFGEGIEELGREVFELRGDHIASLRKRGVHRLVVIGPEKLSVCDLCRRPTRCLVGSNHAAKASPLGLDGQHSAELSPTENPDGRSRGQAHVCTYH